MITSSQRLLVNKLSDLVFRDVVECGFRPWAVTMGFDTEHSGTGR